MSDNIEFRVALAVAYRGLTDVQAQLLRALAACPINIIDTPTAAAILPCDLARAERLLTDLFTLGLLEQGAAHRVLRQLVRSYAQRPELRGEQHEPDRARARLTDYLLASAAAAEALLTPSHHSLFPYTARFEPPPPPFADYDTALAWIGTHHSDLIRLLHTCALHREHDAVWRLAWALWPAFHLLRLDGRLEAQRLAVTSAHEAGQRAAEANLLTSLAGSLLNTGQPDEAMEHLGRALGLFQQLGDLRGQGQAANGLGKGWLALGEPARAEAHFAHALELRTRAGYPRGAAQSLQGLGRAALALRDWYKAADLLARSHTALTESDEPYDAAWSKAWCASAMARLGSRREALALLEQARGAMAELGSPFGQGGVLEIAAAVSQTGGDDAAARASYLAAADLYDRVDPTAAARVRGRLAAIDHAPPDRPSGQHGNGSRP